MRRLLLSAAVAALALPGVAHAGLVLNTEISVDGQGFGNVPRALTVQATGNATSESGCVGVSGSGTITFGSCISDAQVFMGNGVSNAGGDEPPPLADNQKYGIPSLSSLGIDSADDIGILFNVTEPGGDGINLVDLTLKFFSMTGTLLGAIDGSQNFTQDTVTGNGGAGFVFTVDAAQQGYVNGLIGMGDLLLALEATMTNISGGPESFTIVNLNEPTDVPEPAALGLLGLGALGLAAARRRKA